MKPFLLGITVAIVIAIGAAALLSSTQKFAYEAFTTSGARVSDPGYNLVGPRWTGEALAKRS
jgi:hypothetical protein